VNIKGEMRLRMKDEAINNGLLMPHKLSRDSQMKFQVGHAMKSAPVVSSDRACVIPNQRKNVVRKLHGVEKLMRRSRGINF